MDLRGLIARSVNQFNKLLNGCNEIPTEVQSRTGSERGREGQGGGGGGGISLTFAGMADYCAS
jgi:hypothetical protein